MEIGGKKECRKGTPMAPPYNEYPEDYLTYEFPIERFGEGFRGIDVCYFVAGATINSLESEVARMVEIEP